jgi:cbb3-type cytochrome oxidase subunit 3
MKGGIPMIATLPLSLLFLAGLLFLSRPKTARA